MEHRVSFKLLPEFQCLASSVLDVQCTRQFIALLYSVSYVFVATVAFISAHCTVVINYYFYSAINIFICLRYCLNDSMVEIPNWNIFVEIAKIIVTIFRNYLANRYRYLTNSMQ